jgi:hypothetical protein
VATFARSGRGLRSREDGRASSPRPPSLVCVRPTADTPEVCAKGEATRPHPVVATARLAVPDLGYSIRYVRICSRLHCY